MSTDTKMTDKDALAATAVAALQADPFFIDAMTKISDALKATSLTPIDKIILKADPKKPGRWLIELEAPLVTKRHYKHEPAEEVTA